MNTDKHRSELNSIVFSDLCLSAFIGGCILIYFFDKSPFICLTTSAYFGSSAKFTSSPGSFS